MTELREAPNPEKAPLVPAVAAARCSAADLCELRDLCVAAYTRHVAALAEREALARSAATGGPVVDAEGRLAAVERSLGEAHRGALECSRRELAIRTRYRP